MTVVDRMLEEYKRDHTHPANRALHMVGIPTILASLPTMIVAPKVGIGMFVGGWVLQFLGHAFEGKAPTFFRDPRFLLVGATWYGKRIAGALTGKPYPVDPAAP